ncbi:unnamed protein product [Clonostachys chloroleuca]|uniref:Uncharacterized protein n=1 Tax=Clonostachys chloroleuca TaxID=1926264 RepID=A0AA35QFD2_9HYPO|nr:unnamed protein product [Clonostachys chloroleuca]
MSGNIFPLEIWYRILHFITDSGDNATLFNLACTNVILKDAILPMLFYRLGPRKMEEVVTRLLYLIPDQDVRALLDAELILYPKGDNFQHGQSLIEINGVLKNRGIRWIDPIGSSLDYGSMDSFVNATGRYKLPVGKDFNKIFLLLIFYAGIYGKLPSLTIHALEKGVGNLPINIPSLPSPLEAAACSLDTEQVKLLLPLTQKLKAPLSCPNLFFIRSKSLELFQLLVLGGAYYMDREFDFLDTIDKCSLQYVQPYLDTMISLDCRSQYQNMTALHIAARRGELELVKELLFRGARCDLVDRESRTALHIASEEGHVHIAVQLLHSGPMLLYPTSPLHLAAKNGHVEVLRQLLIYTTDLYSPQVSELVDSLGETPLHHASRNGHDDVVNLLLARGSHPGQGNESGITPVHLAAEYGHLNVLKSLFKALPSRYLTSFHIYDLQPGKLSNAICFDDKTPLHFAVRNGHQDITKFLIDKDGNINARDRHGRTPLHYMAELGDSWDVAWLFGLGCKINAQDDQGETALHIAARERRWILVNKLITHGADQSVINTSGSTARQIAKCSRTPRFNRLEAFDQAARRHHI